eukprot:5689200-Prymnesium_polylepis.2
MLHMTSRLHCDRVHTTATGGSARAGRHGWRGAAADVRRRARTARWIAHLLGVDAELVREGVVPVRLHRVPVLHDTA